MDAAYKMLKIIIVILIISIVITGCLKMIGQIDFSTPVDTTILIEQKEDSSIVLTEQEAETIIIPTEQETDVTEPILDDPISYVGLNNKSALAYIEIAIKENKNYLEWLHPYLQSYLFDIDEDGEQELLLNLEVIDEVDGVVQAIYWGYSIYDYENGELTAYVKNEPLCYQMAGGYAHTGVITSKSEDYLLIFDQWWIDGTSGGVVQYTYKVCKDPKEPIVTFRYKETREDIDIIEYYIDQRQVTPEEMSDALQAYSGLVLDENGYIQYTNSGYHLHELLSYLVDSIEIEKDV